jgi:hypothetical protein
MKTLIIIVSLCFFSNLTKAQAAVSPSLITDTLKNVEVSCGKCKFGMKAKDCSLAIRFDGKAYFVDGTSIDDHGDAHADDGFCNKIRHADVAGFILKGRFVATDFKLLKEEPTTVQH